MKLCRRLFFGVFFCMPQVFPAADNRGLAVCAVPQRRRNPPYNKPKTLRFFRKQLEKNAHEVILSNYYFLKQIIPN